MNKNQFDFRHDDIPVLIEAFRKQRPSNSFMILALVCLSLASCSDESSNIKTPSPINEPIEVVDTDDSVVHDSTATGQVEFIRKGQVKVNPPPIVPVPPY